jgi:hypothetical protein
VVQNQALRKTSSWANNWLGRDHATKPADQTGRDEVKEQKMEEPVPQLIRQARPTRIT